MESHQSSPPKQRFRQIHLDFHTSEFIPDIGHQFDPDEFAETLHKAHVNSINCFARCHHGWMYYESDRFPERRHPHLTQNLLPLQIEACHRRDIRVPIYVSLQLDYFTAQKHPEWRLIEPDGRPAGGLMYTPDFRKTLCLNTPYAEFLQAHIAELFELMPVDGLWLDIIAPRDCSCPCCWEDMEKQGLDPRRERDRHLFADRMVTEYMHDLSSFIRKLDRSCLIYYNSGHIWPLHRRASQAFTHFDLESLSSTPWWPYPYFQTTARYARNLGKEIVGMTGKFHTAWGDFHSFKNRAALEFDCFQSLAVNGKCSVGDQLHPSGKIDPVTYELIGDVFAQVAEKEPWCEGARALSEIGVLTTEEFELIQHSLDHTAPLTGVVRMLLEADYQFDVIDSAGDFSDYGLLVLPDSYPLSEQTAARLSTYLAQGGKLIASFEAGMDEHKGDFRLDGIKKRSDGPVDEKGDFVRGENLPANPYAQYIVPEGEIGRGLRPTEYVMYARGMDVTAQDEAEVLLFNTQSYFDRRYKHFCSHQQTPSSGQKGSPAVVHHNGMIYFAHPIFTMYYDKAPRWCKQIFINAVRMLMGEPLVKTSAPSTAIVTLNEQPAENRQVLHLIHYVPERRGQEFDIIEDVIPLHDVAVDVRVPQRVRRIQLVPQEEMVPYTSDPGVVHFVVPRVNGHQMVEIAFQ
ncbi:MAG: beta-galactosidase trimerization domain-containing protein [Ardenticatenaceae bacterium]|nr:beta-galactosidase trimerization domain-containing protein [Ardenticatenaceae bacterium]